jgi:two-component system, probable response regulator PhcQ
MDSLRIDHPVEILIVDDEPQAVKYFKKAFGTKYDVLTATSADEAETLILSGNHNIGLVISDQRMPGRSGVSLLNRVRNERPDIIRMLTTAYADLDSAIDAVNKGEILRYISKPWDLRVLEAEIEQAITFYLLKNEYDMLLRDKLSAMHRTLLRDRMNDMAMMSALLPYRNASLTMYNYLKDALAEVAWRPAVHQLWSQLRVRDHWRIPVEETQRGIALANSFRSPPAAPSNQTSEEIDVMALASECASAVKTHLGADVFTVTADDGPAVISGDRQAIRDALMSMMTSIAHWATAGSTIDIHCRPESQNGSVPAIAVQFELRDCDPRKAMQDCVLFTPPLTSAPNRALDYMTAALTIGHLGGTVSSPPMDNSCKQVRVTLPVTYGQDAPEVTAMSHEWVQNLSDEYEKWILGTLDIAA